MLDTSFWFDGIQGREMGIELSEPFLLSEPEPNVTEITVPGRNGKLHYFDGSFKNRTASAPAFVLGKALQYDVDAINSWLMRSQGYRKLVLESDAEHYLLARAKSGISNKGVLGLLNSFELVFDCKPQRYLIDGDMPYDIVSRQSITNPTDYDAFPKIVLNGDAQGETVYFGMAYGEDDYALLTVEGLNGKAEFDAEANALYGDYEYYTVEGSFKIRPRATMQNTVYPTGIDTKIIPRWWTL